MQAFPTPEQMAEFQATFRVNLRTYWQGLFGFDIVAFDAQVIQSPDNLSMRDTILERYGPAAVKLIEDLNSLAPMRAMLAPDPPAGGGEHEQG